MPRRSTAPIRRLPQKSAPHEGGKLKVGIDGLLPVDPATGVHFSGFTDNWWIGLAMLHTLFTLEHNHICDLLQRSIPTGTTSSCTAKPS